MRYVALLRGINVGGNTMVKMADVKSLFQELGFTGIESYINSGNLAFNDKKRSESAIAGRIEKALKEKFDRDIRVMVREQTEIRNVLDNNPFKGKFDSHKQMHVLFMQENMPKDKEELLTAQNRSSEMFAVRGREIYALLKDGVADSLLGKGYIDKKLKVPVTARNWRTVEKIAQL